MSPPTIESSVPTLEPQAKRLKTTQDHIHQVFYEGLFDSSTQETMRQAVKDSKPYQHCKIDQLVNDDLLRKVRQDILNNIQFTRKETDIYKVNQTGDLANMDQLPVDEKNRLSHLFQLRNGIYSQAFRDLVSHVTGCGPLSGRKMDMSVNIYDQGCHLLNHDDVIGDRRVSFILYMPNPDEEWKPSDGGALELYPVIEAGKSANEPTVSLPPKWNQFAMFTVLPGYSFHSVEEVVAKGKSRLSIQGWFHFPQPGEIGYDPNNVDLLAQGKSSLAQLSEGEHEPFAPCDQNEPDDIEQLVQQDVDELLSWMNPTYLDMKTLQDLAEQFLDSSSLQLQNILQPSVYNALVAAAHEMDEKDNYFNSGLPPHGSGVRGPWQVQGSPVSQRFLRLSTDKTTMDESSQLFGQLQQRLESTAFRHWLALVSKLTLKSYRGMVRRFRPGLDYTLASIPIADENNGLLDVTFSLVSVDDPCWETGDVGGYLCYMASDDNDDASIYRSADQDGALLTLPCSGNELSIVLRDEGVMQFVKYVSAGAMGSRWDMALEFETVDK
ncbi:Oxoglutarate and iron-dependent oxygenase degradation C-term-domain-containing protein [Chlamydoabsidia padenii]|nr:Oxoglutarate and iron-dependent oxygenase degradation C-term-domain-containing protein [Chlamydoabsidia padenii]